MPATAVMVASPVWWGEPQNNARRNYAMIRTRAIMPNDNQSLAATSALARVPVNATYTALPFVLNGPTGPTAVP